MRPLDSVKIASIPKSYGIKNEPAVDGSVVLRESIKALSYISLNNEN